MAKRTIVKDILSDDSFDDLSFHRDGKTRRRRGEDPDGDDEWGEDV